MTPTKRFFHFAALGTVLLTANLAAAQSRYDDRAVDMVLVSPEGDILDYTPEEGEARQARDAQGRTVLLDRRGRLIATLMPADEYYPASPGPVQDDAFGSSTGEVTGSVSQFNDVVSPPVVREELPNSLPAMQGDSQFASIDDQPAQPARTQLPPAMSITKKSSAEMVALQVFLDREGFSPGVIDGRMGSNVTKAIEAWQQANGATLDPNNTDEILERLRLNGGLPVVSYTISASDAAGPYVAAIPEDYAHKAALPHLSYTSVSENLAEKFHMDEAFLKELNPGVDFTIPGTIIKVVNTGETRTGKVARIVADKARKQVLAYDDMGKLISAYPASIGSSDTPSPSGTVQVERIALNPGYTYNPKINFKQGENDKILTLQPGPNGPVGTVWIALSKPTYGIHGTPEPSKIGKTQSHGCVRLTNWDATELAKMVSKGVTVEFVE
ncbi:L,D-transpeptidase family protein [Rhizobium sp. CFBP 8762]|uniref:L,D-transpeptidase family protein n=1 Tax=Rhizobium sp. CFBP 8762 TaxID=2775279 RepID=UPI00313D78B6